MTYIEISKALEYCLAQGITSECERCRDKIGCRDALLRDALDLIHRQAAEKEELEFELIRSRNEMAAWKIRATGYKEMRSKLECKNSELEIELKAMRGAANSYKSEVERLKDKQWLLEEQLEKVEQLNDSMVDDIDMKLKTIYKLREQIKSIKSEARKEFAERLKLMAEKISIATIEYKVITTESIDVLLAKMEERE